ncbi:GNAT family N-acetyltransferase [Clostridium sp. CS001]|uniref:GNAT family N-acetyltransferase n=1 Tax=Clostridium sp. CS001 TaxID=2880648 RepID=UPI001CF3EABF|nr:GNAT family N-acetyltransferase [Clostridium sp. CS001]MCB2289106.1 GNAT family N-acetyltransferase [Clostridium sp. CS001]
MEVKQFNVISSQRKKELYNFIKSVDLNYNKTYVEMIRTYESDIFNDGNNILILIDDDEIKGSMAVITREISIKEEVFITDIFIANENLERNLCFLIERVIVECNDYGARSIKVGFRKDETHLIPCINKLKFNHIYDAVVMRYAGDKDTISKSNNHVELVALSILNSKEYMNIQNEAFKDSPNGGTIDEFEVMDYIIRYANNEDLIGVCFSENKPCGVYELSINGNIGWIDTIGITSKHQKKGLGNALLMKCIKKLYEKELEEIKLLVITSNKVAVKLYEENGFEQEAVFSYWFEKNI